MMFLTKKSLFIASLISGLGLCAAAQAATINYQPQNPAIFSDAPSAGGAALLASAVRPKDPDQAALGAGLTPAEIVQQSVLGQISANINDQIFHGGQASGNFDLGGGNLISYTRVGGNIIIHVTDPHTGTTVITLPDL